MTLHPVIARVTDRITDPEDSTKVWYWQRQYTTRPILKTGRVPLAVQPLRNPAPTAPLTPPPDRARCGWETRPSAPSGKLSVDSCCIELR